jgi:branched-chain amino acid transport system ATP-binding protein
LQVEGISKAFSGLRALDDVSFTLESGQIVGLIGPNGAGKTTLFNIISGSLRPDSGRVYFAGQDITGWPAHRVARCGLARTFQLMKPFASLSVLDNVTVATLQRYHNKAQAKQAARSVIERVGLDPWVNQLAGVLSTAGRKRLELAKALALQPKLLLLDEVLAGITPSERAVLLDMLREILAEGVTMLLVEHVMPAVMSLSDRVLVLHHGKLLASGTPDEITRNQHVIDAYLGEDLVSDQAQPDVEKEDEQRAGT